MIIGKKGSDGFFRVALTRFDWRRMEVECRSFIQSVKDFRPPDERDFDDHDKEWVFANEHYSSVVSIARDLFGEDCEEE